MTLTLQPGSASETVTVTGAPAIMQTDRADVSTNLESHTLQTMPVTVNQNFQSLLTLVPGVGPPVFQHSQFFNAASSIQAEVNGQPREGNSYQIEGIDDDERTGLLQILIPPIQAIETVDVSTSNYEAELGRAIGTVSNVIIKSGTNKFHGMAPSMCRTARLTLAPTSTTASDTWPITTSAAVSAARSSRTSSSSTATIALARSRGQLEHPEYPSAAVVHAQTRLAISTSAARSRPAAKDRSTIRRPAILMAPDERPSPTTRFPYNRVNPYRIKLMKLLAGAQRQPRNRHNLPDQ